LGKILLDSGIFVIPAVKVSPIEMGALKNFSSKRPVTFGSRREKRNICAQSMVHTPLLFCAFYAGGDRAIWVRALDVEYFCPLRSDPPAHKTYTLHGVAKECSCA